MITFSDVQENVAVLCFSVKIWTKILKNSMLSFPLAWGRAENHSIIAFSFFDALFLWIISQTHFHRKLMSSCYWSKYYCPWHRFNRLLLSVPTKPCWWLLTGWRRLRGEIRLLWLVKGEFKSEGLTRSWWMGRGSTTNWERKSPQRCCSLMCTLLPHVVAAGTADLAKRHQGLSLFP